jgi:putative addiction module CopG family antidote
MQLTLPADLEAVVRSQVDSGRFKSSEEVMRRALDLLQQHEDEEKLAVLRADIQKALAEVERGETVAYDSDEIKREGRRRLRDA